MELAGEVEAVGAAVTEFEVGDEVFGVKGSGAHAEFVCMRESGPLAHKPAGMSFEEAAAVCDGAALALACLRKAGPLRGAERPRLRRLRLHRHGGGAAGQALRRPRHRRVQHEERRARAVARSRRGRRLHAGGLHQERRDLRRRLRRRRQALVQALPALAEAGRVFVETDLGFMWHVPLLALLTRWIGDKRVALGITKYTKEDVLFLKELIEAGEYRAGDRPALPAGGRGRGDEVRRDGAEDRQRRPHGRRRPVTR